MVDIGKSKAHIHLYQWRTLEGALKLHYIYIYINIKKPPLKYVGGLRPYTWLERSHKVRWVVDRSFTGVTKAVVCAILLWDDAYKRTLLLIGKSSSCGNSGFPLSLSKWFFTICRTPYNRKQTHFLPSFDNILLVPPPSKWNVWISH